MTDMTDAEYDAAMRQIARDYPEYFTTSLSDAALAKMANDYEHVADTLAYPDRRGRSDRQGAP